MPEEQSFEGRKPRESASSAPAEYQPPPFFATAALQHTNVKLTWDGDDEQRKRTMSKRVTADELREDDFKARPLHTAPCALPSSLMLFAKDGITRCTFSLNAVMKAK